MNWQTGIESLMVAGRSAKEIAAASGLAVSSIYDLKNGYTDEPRGMAAVKLYQMIRDLNQSAKKAAKNKEVA